MNKDPDKIVPTNQGPFKWLPYYPVYYVYNTGNEKDYKMMINKIAYFIITLTTGIVGLHKFYTEKTFLGLLYIVLGVCPYLFLDLPPFTIPVVIIELIIILLKKSDERGLVPVGKFV
jgi:TM2 domain-containing membrane protein YozV